MKKILIISMMLVFGFSFSQERKSETPKEPVKIEISKSNSDVRVYLNMERKLSNLEILFPTPERERTKEC